MATIFDLIEVTSITANTTYSVANGNLLGVVDGLSGTSLSDGEFDVGDIAYIDGVAWRIDAIAKPSSTGTFLLGDGSTQNFFTASESNLDVVFLTISSGSSVRHFIVPNDRFGDMNVQAITTGGIDSAAGSDAKIISTADNDVGIVCFGRGTLIDTGAGRRRPVELLATGDAILTADNGLQPIRWIGSRTLSAEERAHHRHLWPVRIAAGALGRGLPDTPLFLSPQHRVLVRSRIARRMFGSDEVLVAVKHLVGLDGVRIVEAPQAVEYFHIMLGRHELLLAHNLACESLYLGDQAVTALGAAAVAEIGAILPGLQDPVAAMSPVRPLVRGRMGRKLALRHARNRRCLVAAPEAAAPIAP